MNWTIGKKLYLSFGAVIALVLFFSIFVINEMDEFETDVVQFNLIQKEIKIGKDLQLRIAEVWQFLTDASLTKNREVINKEALPKKEEAEKLINQLIKINQGNNDTVHVESLKLLEKDLKKMWLTGNSMFKTYLEDWDKGNLIMAEYDKISNQVINEVAQIAGDMESEGDKSMKEMDTMVHDSTKITIGAASVVVLIGFILAFIITRNITKPLAETVNIANQVAQGDFDITIQAKGSDETAQLLHAMKNMVETLNIIANAASKVAEGDLNLTLETSQNQVQIYNGQSSDYSARKRSENNIFSIMQKMIENLNFVGQVAEKISMCDLTQKLEGDRFNIGIFAAMKQMVANLTAIVRNLTEVASHLAASSEEINAAAESLSEGAQHQSANVEETSASTEELAASIRAVNINATDMKKMSNKSLVEANEYKESMKLISEEMSQINASSKQIGTIVKVINDIADQTNLLSLNASIEAARAGEHGRGFAVVADAISALASRSAESTKEIDKLISESLIRVNRGVDSVGSANSSFNNIVETIAKTKEMVENITAAMEEQSMGSDQIQKATEEISQLTQSVSASAEELSGSTGELYALAEKLNGIVGKFDLGDHNTRH